MNATKVCYNSYYKYIRAISPTVIAAYKTRRGDFISIFVHMTLSRTYLRSCYIILSCFSLHRVRLDHIWYALNYFLNIILLKIQLFYLTLRYNISFVCRKISCYNSVDSVYDNNLAPKLCAV